MASFHPFVRLPPELRLVIWELALVDQAQLENKALSSYKEGSFRAKWEDENGHSCAGPPEVDGCQLALEFLWSLYGPVRLELPMACVNHEARKVAVEWAEHHDRPFGTRRLFADCHIFLRDFKPFSDVVYIPQSLWKHFHDDPFQALGEPMMYGETVDYQDSIHSIAVDECTIRSAISEGTLGSMLLHHNDLRAMYIIDHTSHPLMQQTGHGIPLVDRRLFELREARELTSFLYDKWDPDFVTDRVDGLDAELFELVKSVIQALDGYGINYLKRFEIYAASAIMR